MSETCRVIINQVKQKLHLVGYLPIKYIYFSTITTIALRKSYYELDGYQAKKSGRHKSFSTIITYYALLETIPHVETT